MRPVVKKKVVETAKDGPGFQTPQERDIYVLGLLCGGIGLLQGWCDDRGLVYHEEVEDVLLNMAAYLESALESGEASFEEALKSDLGGGRASVDALVEAWELGYKNGLQIEIGPLPTVDKHRKKRRKRRAKRK